MNLTSPFYLDFLVTFSYYVLRFYSPLGRALLVWSTVRAHLLLSLFYLYPGVRCRAVKLLPKLVRRSYPHFSQPFLRYESFVRNALLLSEYASDVRAEIWSVIFDGLAQIDVGLGFWIVFHRQFKQFEMSAASENCFFNKVHCWNHSLRLLWSRTLKKGRLMSGQENHAIGFEEDGGERENVLH